MTTTPTPVASRRSLLRTAAAAGSAAVVLPVLAPVVGPSVPGLAGFVDVAQAAGGGAARAKVKAKRCRTVKVKVKGKVATRKVCKPTKKTTTTGTGADADKDKGKGKGAGTGTGTAPGTTTPTPTPVPLPAGGLLSAADRHLASRFSYGIDRTLADDVLRSGGGAAWFESQLTRAGTSDPATDGLLGWWPSLSRTPQDLWRRQQAGTEGGWEVMSDYQRYVLVRRVRSTRPVLDIMTEFWENHFNVPVQGDGVFTHRVSYGQAIRERALGSFESLLQATITHPAMLIYLNGAVSTKARPNENLGRELLELHTVGRGQYSEDDVKASARILTGYRVATWSTWVASYQTNDHWTGAVKVMSFEDANAAPDGRAVAAAYLRYLAHHPATAQRIARKLAVKFVSDAPSQALVDRLAAVYLANGTAIAPVLRALVGSAEFAASANGKVRDPAEDVVATYRVLGVQIQPPTGSGDSAERAILWQTANLGLDPHNWPRPDGAPTDNASWSSTSRLLASLDLHYIMSGGWWPSTGVGYRTPQQWMPASAVSFADLVEHLSRELLHTTTPAGLLAAACQAAACQPGEVITPTHALVRWKFARLLTTVLDCPLHLKR